MKTLTIIDALCTMGNTEGVGRFATPYSDEITDFMADMFGGGNRMKMQIVGDILEDTYYMYSYDETLGNHIADAIVQIYDDDFNIESEVFLYEIEV